MYSNITDSNPEPIIDISDTAMQNSFLQAEFAGNTFLIRNFKSINECLEVHVFEYVKHGRIFIECNGKKYVANEGDTYILKQGTSIKYYSAENEQIEKTWFNMKGILLDKLFEAYNLTDDVIVVHSNIEAEIKEIHNILQASVNSPEVICGLAIAVHKILMKISLDSKSISLSFTPGATIAEKIKNYLLSNIYADGSLEVLAQCFHITSKHIIYVFKSKYGITPHAFLIQERIKEATRLLQFTELPVKSIAEKLKFSEGNYFARVFKRHTGLSPVEYRHMLSQNTKFDNC